MFFTATSDEINPTAENTSVPLSGTLIVNIPFASVITAVLPPFTTTLIPSKGLLRLSVTLPVTVICARDDLSVATSALTGIEVVTKKLNKPSSRKQLDISFLDSFLFFFI